MDIIKNLKVGGTTYEVKSTLDLSTYRKIAFTLSSAPTTSTKTNGSYTYQIGDEVRVQDANGIGGYSFYRLYAINNNNAIWCKLTQE